MSFTAHRLALIALVVATFIWGSTFVVVHDLLDGRGPNAVPPLRYLAIRFGIATALLAIFWGKHLRGMSRRTFVHGATLGVFLGGGYLTQALGLANGSPSKAAFITGLAVLFVPLFGTTLGMTRLTRGNLAGLAVAFVGFAMLCWPGEGMAFRRGDLLTFACTILFAFHILFTERYAGKSDPNALNILQLGLAALTLAAGSGVLLSLTKNGLALPGPLAAEARPFALTARQGAQFIYLIMFATIVCYQVQTRAQRYVSATQTALVLTLEPVFAAFIAWIFGIEKLGLRELVGGALTIVGVLVSELYPKKAGDGEWGMGDGEENPESRMRNEEKW